MRVKIEMCLINQLFNHRYESVEGHLVVGVEQARNLTALAFPPGSKVYVLLHLI